MSKKKVLILGAGLAGLSAAWYLQKMGINCSVFEKEPEAGGLCRSKEVKGFIFDYDGHLMHFRQQESFNLVKELLGNNMSEYRRNAQVYCFNRYIPYPFQANLYGLPKPVVNDCLKGFLAARKSRETESRKCTNFLVWIMNNFGEGIARHFMVPYNRKFWTVPVGQLTCDWLDNFIPVPSPEDVIKGATGKNAKQFGYNTRFWYPKHGGIGELANAFAKRINNLYTDTQIKSIDIERKLVTVDKSKEKFDILIFTAPMPELPNLIKDLPDKIRKSCGKLRWNSILNINLGLDRRNNEKYHWAYFPENIFSFFRLGFYHNFSATSTPQLTSSLYAEMAYPGDKIIDKPKTIKKVKSDLKKIGIIDRGINILAKDVNDIKYGYPIYDRNYALARLNISDYLLNQDIVSCGRYGAWCYMSMEDAILSGKESAEKVGELL